MRHLNQSDDLVVLKEQVKEEQQKINILKKEEAILSRKLKAIKSATAEKQQEISFYLNKIRSLENKKMRERVLEAAEKRK
jgi:hypothetical protein